MALNQCSINGFTLNSRRCSDKFAALVPILHPTVPPIVASGGGNPRVLRDTFRFEPRPYEIEDDRKLTFEQPHVSVTVEIFGFSGVDSQDVTGANADFVTAHDFTVTAAMPDGEITVNIPDIRFE
jgi:hypothetical protein